MLVGFSEPPPRCQRPSQRVVREDIRAHSEFLLGETKGERKVLSARRQKKREGSWIAGRAALPNFFFERTGLIGVASTAQGFGKCPLVFGQRIQSRRALQWCDGFSEFLGSQQHEALGEQRG